MPQLPLTLCISSRCSTVALIAILLQGNIECWLVHLKTGMLLGTLSAPHKTQGTVRAAKYTRCNSAFGTKGKEPNGCFSVMVSIRMNIAKAAVCTKKESQLDSLRCQHRFYSFCYSIKKVEKMHVIYFRTPFETWQLVRCTAFLP